jgi:hypothetical protein
MTGTTPLQQKAQWKRSQLIRKKHRLHVKEPKFKYIGDTVVVWDVRQYLQEQNKDELLRKSYKRKRALLDVVLLNEDQVQPTSPPPPMLRNNRKRFRAIYQQLYQESEHKQQKQQQESDS